MNKNAKLLNSLLGMGTPTTPTNKKAAVPPKGKKKATKKATKKPMPGMKGGC